MHKLTAFVLVGLLCKQLPAQSIPFDTAAYRQGVEAAVASFHLAMGVEAELYNGIEHVRYLPTIEGIAYYQVDEWQNGTIEYNGVVYKEVPMRYDLVKDQVVVKHPNNYQSFSLFSPRVKSFTLGGSHFVYLADEDNGGAPAVGFYQVLARGPLTVLARRSKKIEDQISDRKLQFVTMDKYYVVKDGAYYSPRNEKALLALVGDRRKEAKQLLQQKHIRFKKLPEAAILTIAEFYNQ